MILGLNILEHKDYPEVELDKEELRKSYIRFQDEAVLGIHDLAAIAVEHLARMFMDIGVPMEGVEYYSSDSDTRSTCSRDYDFPQTYGQGLRIPDTLNGKRGDMCNNSWGII